MVSKIAIKDPAKRIKKKDLCYCNVLQSTFQDDWKLSVDLLNLPDL